MTPLYKAFALLLIASCCYSAVAGGRDGRIAVAMLLSAALSTPLAVGTDHQHLFVALIDAALFVGLLVLAMRSSHYWPLWLAGMHAAGLVAHIVAYLNPNLPGKVYHAIIAFWSIPMQVVIVIGIIADRRGQHDGCRSDTLEAKSPNH